MIEISRVISSVIENGRRIVKALIWGADDRRNHIEVMPFGVDSVPVRNLRAVVVQTTTKEDRIVLGYINTNQQAEEGEYRIYSIDENGAQATYLWLKADGTIELGGNADTAVKYSELETAFNQLKADHDALVDAVNANSQDLATFASQYIPGGPTVVGLPATFIYGDQQESASTADITPAEAPNVKLGN